MRRDGLRRRRAGRVGARASACWAATPPAATVFVGGGTPTLLPAERARAAARRAAARAGRRGHGRGEPGLRRRAPTCARCARPGATRLSLGMQSAAGHVLATLDRSHTPGAAVAAAHAARDAGFAHVSLDLIHGAPGERDEDWDATLAAVAEAGVDHVSAYPLTVEPGTRLHAQVRRGALPAPDADAPGAPLPARRRGARRARARVVRDLQLGGVRGRALRAQRRLLALARLVGPRARAPTRTSAACAGGTCCTRAPTRSACARRPLARRRARAAHGRRSGRWSARCSGSGCARGWRSSRRRRRAAARARRRRPARRRRARARRRAADARGPDRRRPRRARASRSRAWRRSGRGPAPAARERHP